MKTITIRLSEVEAWALDRLAGVNGLSKNKQIANLIVNAYEEIDPGADIVENDLISVTADICWPSVYYGETNDRTEKEILTKAIKIARYVLENECTGAKDENIALIEDLRDDLLQKYKEV